MEGSFLLTFPDSFAQLAEQRVLFSSNGTAFRVGCRAHGRQKESRAAEHMAARLLFSMAN